MGWSRFEEVWRFLLQAASSSTSHHHHHDHLQTFHRYNHNRSFSQISITIRTQDVFAGVIPGQPSVRIYAPLNALPWVWTGLENTVYDYCGLGLLHTACGNDYSEESSIVNEETIALWPLIELMILFSKLNHIAVIVVFSFGGQQSQC